MKCWPLVLLFNLAETLTLHDTPDVEAQVRQFQQRQFWELATFLSVSQKPVLCLLAGILRSILPAAFCPGQMNAR